MSTSLETRAHQAAESARASVASPAAQSLERRRLAPPSATPRRPPGSCAAILVGAAAVVVLLFVALEPRPDDTQVTTAPAAPTGLTAPPRPGLRPPAPGPGGVQLATGTASDGRRWTLSLSGPSTTGPNNEVCFSMPHDERFSGSVCAGRPAGVSPPVPDRYVPLQFADTRLPAFVFGRVPAGVGHVDVEVSRGRSPERHSVIAVAGQADGFYAVELPRGASPQAVVGLRADSTTVRYEVPRGEAPKPMLPSGWNPATLNLAAGAIALGLLLVVGAIWAVRRSRRRHPAPPPPL